MQLPIAARLNKDLKMKTAYNNYLRPSLRVALLVMLFVGPLAGVASAIANGNSQGSNGAGFVLYVSLMRG
jgi:hypothetical protein